MLFLDRSPAPVAIVLLHTFAFPIGADVRAAEGVATAHDDDNGWSYCAGADRVRPIARSISLTQDRPQDMTEDVVYRGKLRRYAQLRYGSENSRRVVIVVDELGDGEYGFFVDADRDRRITTRDLVRGEGRSRTCEMETEILREDRPEQDVRQVQMRLGATRTRLSVATLGCVEGSISWPESTQPENADPSTPLVRVRRIDGNANGLFADARDRLLIDVNGDGQWDPVSEQFAYLPVLTIAGRRYAVRSDRLGQKFSLSEITGVGHLRVVVAQLPESARVMAFEAMVFSDDGSAYSLKQPDKPLSVPAGRYTLGSVTMTIDTGQGEPWHFVFSRSRSIGANDWITVAAEQDVALEAVGTTRFVLHTNSGHARPGDGITVSPQLYTQDGLLINLSCRGRQMGSFDSERYHNRCDIKLTSPRAETLSAARSGFA